MQLGFSELLIVLLAILILIGPDNLPKTARQLGRYYSELQKYRRMLEEEFRKGLEEVERGVEDFVEPVKEVASEIGGDASLKKRNGSGGK